MKVCKLCSREKPLDQFFKKKKSTDGYFAKCKVCSTAEVKKWRSDNAEKVMQTRLAWEAKNEVKILHDRKVYYANNVEKTAETNRLRYAANKEYFSRKNREWREAHKEDQCLRGRLNKARRRGAPGVFGKEDIQRIAFSQKNRCAYCQCRLVKNRHIDHIIPVSKGGSNWPRNLQLLCAPCNQSKKDKMPEVHARRIGLLV